MTFDVDRWIRSLESTSWKYFMMAGTAFLVFYILFAGLFRKIKIQQAFPKHRDYYRDILFSFLSMIIFATISYLVFVTLRPYNHIFYGTIDGYGRVYFYLSFVWMFFLHDAYFYWMHRFMHLPFLFRHVHRVHHRSSNPSPWTAYAFHPLEAVIEAGIIPLVAFTLPVQRAAFTAFMIFQLAYNVYGHLGYEIIPEKFSKGILGKWMNTSTRHNHHHKHFLGNYGLYTVLWDRLLNTLRKE